MKKKDILAFIMKNYNSCSQKNKYYFLHVNLNSLFEKNYKLDGIKYKNF